MDDNIKMIQAEIGLKGFAIVVKLWQTIYREHGYYCEWNEEKKLLPYGVHEHNGKRFILPFIHESSGTKAAYCTLFSLVSILMFGSVAILDADSYTQVAP